MVYPTKAIAMYVNHIIKVLTVIKARTNVIMMVKEGILRRKDLFALSVDLLVT